MVEQWIVAPKVAGSSPASYPLMLFQILNIFNRIQFYNQFIINSKIFTILFKLNFLDKFFFLNELIWQEGFLFDFLQKKLTDSWIRKFLIYSAYLFNERLVFDKIIRFYLDLIIWPSHFLSIFESTNVAYAILMMIFNFIIIIFILFLFYCFSFLF